MANILKTEAVVLKKRLLLNQDLLVVLFSESQGKIVVIAKGTRKITSKRLPHLDTANLINVILNKRKERLYLQESRLISGFSQLKADEKKVTDLYQFFYVIEKLLPENQKEEQVYHLVKLFLIEMSKSKETQGLLTDYFNQLLKILGYIKKKYPQEQLQEIISDLIDEKISSFNI
jgi:Recombinational DNA repair protein (RecF pathway)